MTEKIALRPSYWANVSGGKENYKQSTGFTGPILKLIEKANLDIHYETSEEILHQFEREKNQYEK